MPCRVRRVACVFALLLAHLGTVAPVRAEQPPTAQAKHLQNEVLRAFEAEDWPRAIELGLQLHPINPRGGNTAFNLALAYEKAGDPAKAAEWLVTAGRDGFGGATMVNTTPELAQTRKQPKFNEAIQLITGNRAKQLELFKEEASKVEPLVILPPKHNPALPAPLIIALHGTGMNGKQKADAWRVTAERFGAILVCPDALRPAGNGFHWMYVDESEWLVLRTVEWVTARHKIDQERMILTGFSQGANVSMQVSTKHPDAFDGVIVCCGHYEPHAQPLSDRNASIWPRYALLTGDRDEGAKSNRDFAEALKARGIAVDLRVYKGMGHSLPRAKEKELKEAVEFVLGE